MGQKQPTISTKNALLINHSSCLVHYCVVDKKNLFTGSVLLRKSCTESMQTKYKLKRTLLCFGALTALLIGRKNVIWPAQKWMLRVAAILSCQSVNQSINQWFLKWPKHITVTFTFYPVFFSFCCCHFFCFFLQTVRCDISASRFHCNQ